MTRALVRTLLDTLPLGDDRPPDLAARWKRLRLEALPDLIAFEGAGTWLYRRLRASGVFDSLPREFRERLKGQAFAASVFGLRVEDEAVSVLRILAGAGIPVVLIKGVARRALAGRFPYLDARQTSDVDLLLPEDVILEAHALLKARGYEPTPNPREFEHHHLPGLWSERRVSVELHRTTSMRIPPALAWKRATEGGEEVEWAGIRARVPSPTEIAWAAVTHAVNGAVVSGYRLQHFLELAALGAVPGVLDWSELSRRTRNGETFDEESDTTYPDEVAQQWLDGALRFTGTVPRPEALSLSPLDLETMLAWRLRILEARRRLGRAMTERMLEEGIRALVGLGPQGAPAGTHTLHRWRRRTASGVSRFAFHAWRLGRKVG